MSRSVFFAFFVVLAAAGQVTAQVPDAASPASPAPAPELRALPVDVQADRLEYRDNNKTLVAIGNVTITQGESVLRADYMTIDTDTYDVHGKGNVDISHKGRTYQGDEFDYNMNTQVGDFEEFLIHDPPFYITAEDSQQLSQNEFLLKGARVTTCEGDNPEFYVRARESRVIRGEEARSKHVFFYLGGVPFFYLPVAKTNLSGDKSNIDVVPGYSDRMGAFLLTAYNYDLNDVFSAATHLDYRDRRGIGVGQDLFWKDKAADTYQGEARVYYLNDDQPFEDAEDEAATGDLVDADRYRIKLRHRQNLSDRDTLRLRGDYLSDPDVLEDFFDREFRYNTQPENYVTLTHRESKYTADVTVNKRVNDFYDNIDRVPEFTFRVPRLQLGDSSFYYSSDNSASYLTAAFADQLGRDDYDAGRIDSSHTVYYYTRQFGFLNLIPRMGYAGTYYSKTIGRETVTEQVATTNEFGEVTVTESTKDVANQNGGADLRNVYELGFDTSFKAFRVLDSRLRGDDMGRRHVFEPYLGYTYIPEPNLEPQDLLPFDSIDQRDEVNDLLIGMRNKLQTKRRGYVHDLIDLNLYTIYNVEKVNGETEDLPYLYFDAEFRYIDGFWIDVDGIYDLPGGEINTFNTQISLRNTEWTSASLEYRYRKDARDLVAGEINLFPNRRWSYTGYARYNIDESDLEEHSHLITRKSRCLGVGVGFREIDGDLTLWGQVWLQAFPHSMAELGR